MWGVFGDAAFGAFWHGFLAAGVTKAVSPAIQNSKLADYPAAQISTAAIVGGTVSRATGGKFANGAVTAAMAYAFNQASRNRYGTPSERRERAERIPDPVADSKSLEQSTAFELLQQEVENFRLMVRLGRVDARFMDAMTINEIRLVEYLPVEPGSPERVHGRNMVGPARFGGTESNIRVSLYGAATAKKAFTTVAWEIKRGDPSQFFEMGAHASKANSKAYAEYAYRRRVKFGD